MPPSVTLRDATERDLDGIFAIERASFADPWSRAAFGELLHAHGLRFQLAECEDGATAGYVVAWLVGDEGELANLAVAPTQRRRGVAGALLDAVLQSARASGVRAIHLEVRESNAAARALYARYGFTEVGRRRGYYRHPVEDALRLRLDLAAAG